MKRTINLFIIFFLSAVIITSNSTYIYAKKNNKYITRYNKIDTKAKKYIQKGYDCVIISESKKYNKSFFMQFMYEIVYNKNK